jgi:hypothetical protein
LNFKIILIQKSPNIGLILIQKFDSKSLTLFVLNPNPFSKFQNQILTFLIHFFVFSQPSLAAQSHFFLFFSVSAQWPLAHTVQSAHLLAQPTIGLHPPPTEPDKPLPPASVGTIVAP